MLTSTFIFLATFDLASMALAEDHVLVKGFPVPQGRAVPPRKDINDLQAKAGPQWDLYIQAVTKLQGMSQQDKKGWFQVMGLHGLPFIEYDNAGPRNNPGGGRAWGGYCPHGEPVFLAWHRPYVMLYEKILVEAAVSIAETYPADKKRLYRAAAHSLRSPYWDWSADSDVPGSTVPLNLTINGPDGPTTVPNPLQTYVIPKELFNGDYGPFDHEHRPEIYRCRSPYTYPASANTKLAARNIKTNIYATFTHAATYAQFASTGNSGVGLETMHNWIHQDSTCDEQMLNLALSAFDPLFMLHHTNVDRLWAYWQYLQPDQGEWTGSYKGGARWATAQGSIITPDSELQPFFRTNAALHTSRTISDLNGLGYTYDGLDYWSMNADQLKKSATKVINTLFGPSSASKTSSRRGTAEERRAAAGKTTQYFVRVEVDRADIERPANVAVYIDGQKSGDLIVMELPTTGQLQSGFCVDDFIETARGNNGTAASVIDGKITVDIVRPDGSHIPVSRVPSLKVALHEVTVTPPQSIEELPEVSEPTIYKFTAVDQF